MFSGHLKLPQTISDSSLGGTYSGSQVPPVGGRRHLAAFAPLAIVGESLAGSAIVRVFIFWPIAVALYAAKCPVVYMGRARSDRGFAGARLERS